MALVTTPVVSISSLTTTERDALGPVQSGTMIFNESLLEMQFTVNDGTTWFDFATKSEVDAIDLQQAYNEGNIIQLDGVRDIIFKNSSAQNIFTVSDTETSSFINTFIIRNDLASGPVEIFRNKAVGSLNQNLLTLTLDANDSGGNGYSAPFFNMLCKNANPGLYSQSFNFSTWDNGTYKLYLTADGNAQTIQTINNSTKSLDFIATINDFNNLVPLQVAYNAGNIIQLDGINDLTIKNSSSQNIFTFSDASTTSSINTFVMENDTFVGPQFLFRNLSNPAVNENLCVVTLNAKSDPAIVYTDVFMSVTVKDPINATYSQGFDFNLYDNGSFLTYIQANGSTKSIKVPNSTTKILDDIATISDFSGIVTLQLAYDGGNIIKLDGVNNFIVENSGSITILETSPSFVACHTAFNIINPTFSGPFMAFSNQQNASIGQSLVTIDVSSRSQSATSKSHILFSETVSDPLEASYSTKLDVTVYDINVPKNYIEIDGSTQTIKVPNNTTKILNEVATLDDIPVIPNPTLQDIYDNGPFVVMTAIPFRFQSNTTDVPKFELFSNVTGSPGQGIFEFNTKSQTSTNGNKEAVALRYETTNAVDATFSQDVLMQAWSFNSLTTVLNFVGIERALYTSPRLIISESGGVDPWLTFNNTTNGSSDSANFITINKADNGDDKTQFWINKNVQDATSAGFSTTTVITDWWNGSQRAWLSTDPINETVTILGQLTVRQNDPTYGQSTSVEDFLFQDGRLINFNGPGTSSGTQLSSSVTADEAITAGSVIAISQSTDFRAVNHPITGIDSVIGVATTTVAVNNVLQYCYIGDADVQLEDGTGCTRGDLLVPSDVTPGRAVVNNNPGIKQSFAAAWETVAPATPGPLVNARIGISDVNNEPARANMYFNGNATITDITAVNTPVNVAGTFISTILNDFTHLAGVLTYTGLEQKTFSINVDATNRIDSGGPDNTSIGIEINGTPFGAKMSEMSTVDNSIVGCSTMVVLSTNDTINVYVENNTDATDIIVESINCNVTQC